MHPSNRSKLRQLKKITYRMMRQTHDLEKGGKRRALLLSKNRSLGTPITLMLMHMRNLLDSSLTHVTPLQASTNVAAYLQRFDSFANAVNGNCATTKPLRSRVVSGMLKTHTDLFNFLLAIENGSETIEIDRVELGKMIQAGVMAWNNSFRSR